MSKHVSLSSFEDYKRRTQGTPAVEPVPESQPENATAVQLRLAQETLNVLVKRYPIHRTKLMRAIGMPNIGVHQAFPETQQVPVTTVQKLAKIFGCKTIGDFFLLADKKTKRSHIEQLLREQDLLYEPTY